MSEETKKTNPIVRFLGKRLGLVTQEEIQDFVAKAGIPQGDRPLQRSSLIIGQAIPPDMKTEDYLKAYTGWVFACVRVISEETADLNLQLFKRKNQSQFDLVEQHPVLDLLYKVNPLYTSYLLWEATTAYLELTGESFWWLVGPKDRPKEIWTLRPDWVKVKDSNSKLIDYYTYGPPGTPEAKRVKIPFEQVVHMKDFNPTNAFRGYGVPKAAAKTIDEDNFQKDYSRNFFYNSALPGGALETDQNLDEEQYKRIRDDWEATHRGAKKAWKVAILEAGLKWQDIGMSRRDMDFIEGRKLTRDDVLAMFRVPKPLLTFDDVNRAAATEARAILLENVITHKMRRICAFLNEFLLPRYGDDSLFFNFEDPVPNDETVKIAKYDNALRHGWMTRNEIREEEGLEPIEGGDKLLVPFSLQDIGAEQTPQGTQQQQYKKLTSFNLRIPPYPYSKHVEDVARTRIEHMAYSLLKMLSFKKKDINTLSTKNTKVQEGEVIDDDPREQHWKTMVSRTDPREVKYIHILSGLLSDQEQRVKNRVDTELKRAYSKNLLITKERVKANIADIADVTTDNDIFSAPLMDFVRSIIEAEGIQQIQSIVNDAVFYMQTPEIQKYLKKDGAKFITAINEETTTQLQQTLADAIEKQESIGQIKKRIEDVYEDARGYRATRIARSEVLRATNFATEQAYIQSKVVVAKEWLTAKDERVCPWCGPMDGRTIELQEVYFEKGDTVTGTNEKGKKVTLTVGVADISHPPLHPNCRCTIIPVVQQEDAGPKKQLLTELANATLKELRQEQGN